MKRLLSCCRMVAELEGTFQCHVDLVMKNVVKDEKFLEEIGKGEVKLYEK